VIGAVEQCHARVKEREAGPYAGIPHALHPFLDARDVLLRYYADDLALELIAGTGLIRL